MAWTAPRTWVAFEIPTAGTLNTHIRDNLLATEAAVITTAGDLAYASAANALARLPRGTSGQYLQVAAGVPGWASVVSGHPYISGAANLTNVTAGYSATTWTQWGSEEAAIADPAVNCDLFGFLHGTVVNSAPTTATDVQLRVSLSIDGGANWLDGTARTASLYHDGTAGKVELPGHSIHSWLNQNPTGEIQLRGYFYSGNTGIDFYDGHLLLLAVKL